MLSVQESTAWREWKPNSSTRLIAVKYHSGYCIKASYTEWKKSLCTCVSCLTTWLNLTAWQPTARVRGTLHPHQRHVTPHSNYVIMVIKTVQNIFACFCTVIIRCTETFWSPCIYICSKNTEHSSWNTLYKQSKFKLEKRGTATCICASKILIFSSEPPCICS
jgi:hypothetical protein